MKDDAADKAATMLRAFLTGATFAHVARQSGITPSAAELRIKALARNLQRVVGVVGVHEGAVPCAALLRMHKDAYLEALAHYRPHPARAARERGRAMSDGEIDLLLNTTRRRSNCPIRDVALLLVLFSTAARPLEIARLKVDDYLNADGSVREESVMPPDAAIGGMARPLFFTSARTNAALDAYLADRVRQGHGIQPHATYRGLQPYSRLFLTSDGQPMAIRCKGDGTRRQYHCRTILDIYRKLFLSAGLDGLSALAARRTAAHKLKQRGVQNSEIGMLLGLTDADSIRNLLRTPANRRVPADAGALKARVREIV